MFKMTAMYGLRADYPTVSDFQCRQHCNDYAGTASNKPQRYKKECFQQQDAVTAVKDEIKQETYKRDLSAPLSLEAAEAASEKSRAAVFLRPDPPFPSQSRGRWLAGLLSGQCSAARLHQTDAELRFLAASEEHQRKRSELGSGTWGIGLISLRPDVASFCTVHVPLIADVAL